MSIFEQIEGLKTLFSLDTLSSLYIVDAAEIISLHVPPFPPEVNSLIVGINSKTSILSVKNLLLAVFPKKHQVKIAIPNGQKRIESREINVDEIDDAGDMIAVLIPTLSEGTAFERFQEIVAHLRAPDGCPWDREQTHLTLRKHLIEESYEALDAIDSGSQAKMKEEFGDLLLQIVLNAQIASETGDFSMTGVIQGIHDKIVRRHPHVFGDVAVTGVENVLQNWEKIKADEREKGGEPEKGLLDGLPASLPALVQAQEIQNRAARVGFDWPEIKGVLEKIKEEIEEVEASTGLDELSNELGDLFFALVNLARWKGVDAESALRGTNKKFRSRFAFIENQSRVSGRRLSDLSLDEMELLWQAAKQIEGG